MMACSFGVGEITPDRRGFLLFAFLNYLIGAMASIWAIYSGFSDAFDHTGVAAYIMLGFVYASLVFLCVDSYLKPEMDKGC